MSLLAFVVGVLVSLAPVATPAVEGTSRGFDRDEWPHGKTGPAFAHGAVFSPVK